MLRRLSRSDRLKAAALDVLRASRGYLAALLAFLTATALLLHAASLPPAPSAQEVIVRVPEGATDRQVADALHEQGLIRSRAAFAVIRHIGYEGRPFVPGTYRFRKDTRLFAILDRLVNGEIAVQKVTFPEGFTIRQMASRMRTFFRSSPPPAPPGLASRPRMEAWKATCFRTRTFFRWALRRNRWCAGCWTTLNAASFTRFGRRSAAAVCPCTKCSPSQA